MINNYLPRETIIKDIDQESEDTKLFKLVFRDEKLQKSFSFNNGQFLMAGIPGEAEAAFNICSDPLVSKKYFEISVRKVGRLTEVIHRLKKGDKLWVRGPYGLGWPKFRSLTTKNLLLIGGGCGFVPLRSVVLEILNKKNSQTLSQLNIQVFYGCNRFGNLLFKNELISWQKNLDIKIIFDKEKKLKKFKNLQCDTGLITKLFDLYPPRPETTAFLCGPPIMYRFVLKKLKEAGIEDNNIYLSLERRMDCGFGICQHCASDDKYVCQDGPIFKYSEIKETSFIS